MGKPTFEQMEEFHEQTKSGRITQENLQAFLRDPNHERSASEIHVGDIIPKGWTVADSILSQSDNVSRPGPRRVELRAPDGGRHRPNIYWSGKYYYLDLNCFGGGVWLICGQMTSSEP